MGYAQRISRDVGIRIRWVDSELEQLSVTAQVSDRFPREWFGSQGRDGPEHRQFLTDNGFNEGCNIAAFAALRTFEQGAPNRGVTLGVDIDEYPGRCATAERNDDCCVTVREDDGTVLSASVAYLWPRNALGPWTARFILAHEIGHWLGLCHPGHERITEIMYTERSIRGTQAS